GRPGDGPSKPRRGCLDHKLLGDFRPTLLRRKVMGQRSPVRAPQDAVLNAQDAVLSAQGAVLNAQDAALEAGGVALEAEGAAHAPIPLVQRRSKSETPYSIRPTRSLGQFIGPHLRIEGRLGRGGTADVFLAR